MYVIFFLLLLLLLLKYKIIKQYKITIQCQYIIGIYRCPVAFFIFFLYNNCVSSAVAVRKYTDSKVTLGGENGAAVTPIVVEFVPKTVTLNNTNQIQRFLEGFCPL